MSTVFDINAISVNGGTTTSIGVAITEVVITDAMVVPNIDINIQAEPETIEIQVPGVQGPPGLQNVYVGPDDPSVLYGWGPEEENFIWIRTQV
jgi:hypothetical protein